VLGLIYIFAIAKPISMRRLSLLFVLALISASLALRALHVTSPRAALLTATSLTLFAWSGPLLHIMHATVSRRALSLDALRQVSGFVCWTYGCAITAMPIVAVSAILNPTQSLHLAVLHRSLAIAGVSALFLMVAAQVWQKRQPVHRGLACGTPANRNRLGPVRLDESSARVTKSRSTGLSGLRWSHRVSRQLRRTATEWQPPVAR
jgi:hypothetical protein